MYKCRYFKIFELVSKEYYDSLDETILWFLLDQRFLMTIDNLREKFGPIIINDYYWGGEYNQSGLRQFDSGTGANFSQHKFGRAGDLKFKNVTVNRVRNSILNHPFSATYKYITGIELEVPWLHIDVRNWNKEKYGLYQFNPGS